MMTDAPRTPSTALALAAAGFLAQALELGDDPAAIAPEFTELSDTGDAAIYSVELDSSVGTAAFLVYAFARDEGNDISGDDGDAYQQALATLAQAAERDTPGPRLVANAENGQMAFILATTPATWRRLQGDASGVVATEANLPITTVSAEERATLAEDLHRSLRETNEHARAWLTAMRNADAGAGTVTFTDAETALALHVLDEGNVTPLLTALNALIASAQEQAGTALAEEHGDA